MALRDEIEPRQNRLHDLGVWIDAQSNGEEWYDLIYNLDYSNHSIAKLLSKHGFKCDWNVVYRFRRKHVSK
jgi:hypothetical protein